MPNDQASAIVPAAPGEAARVLDVLTRAFAADPPSRWMYPEEREYLQNFPRFVQALGGAAFEAGTALVSEDVAGAALWLAPDASPDEDALARLIDETLAAEKQAYLAAVIDAMVGYHPQEPHWYLPFIGVDPARQGRGLGAALLRPMLARCDAQRLPAYLESTNPRNQPLYRRHGFEALGEIRIGSCPPVTPMLRRPNKT